jgi:CubicO group peptidase (beta-lactamase class C family)
MGHKWKKRGLILIAVSAAVLIAAAGGYLIKALPIGTGYAAKYLCTSLFVSHRNPEIVFQEDVAPVNPLSHIIRFSVHPKQNAVTAWALGRFVSTAVHRDGCGCTLLVDTDEETLLRQSFYSPRENRSEKTHPPGRPWPAGDAKPEDPARFGVNRVKLEKAIDLLFAEPSPERHRKTRAVLVVYDGHLIAERYAPGFTKDMPLLGWSMSKSITNALVGILVKKGRLDLHAPAPVPEWQHPSDRRRRITLDHLMHMTSGLEFSEVYAPLYDATDMLYGSADFAAYAAAKPLETEPGRRWHYSSGTANIIAGIVRRAIEAEAGAYYSYLQEALFEAIGMRSAVMEPDPSGTFVGSSYIVATPRDWARFGLLYLNDGVFNGNRILPEGWVDYTTTPVPHAPKGQYGALFWLNAGSAGDPADRRWPEIPADAYSAEGFQGQRVVILPSRKLVLVRFGATSRRSAWNDRLWRHVLAALPEKEAAQKTPSPFTKDRE